MTRRLALLALALCMVLGSGVVLKRWPDPSGTNRMEVWPGSPAPIPIFWNSFEEATGCTASADVGKQQDGSAAPGTIGCPLPAADPDHEGRSDEPHGDQVLYFDPDDSQRLFEHQSAWTAMPDGEWWLRFRIVKSADAWDIQGNLWKAMLGAAPTNGFRVMADDDHDIALRCNTTNYGDTTLTVEEWHTLTVHGFYDGSNWDMTFSVHDEDGAVLTQSSPAPDCGTNLGTWDGYQLLIRTGMVLTEFWVDCMELYREDPGPPGTPGSRCQEPGL